MTEAVNAQQSHSLFGESIEVSGEEMAEALVTSAAGHASYDPSKSRLIERLENVLIAILGTPTSQSETEWRYGSNGSLSIDVGPKRGAWKDFESDEGGGIIKLLARQWELDPANDSAEIHQRSLALLERLPEEKSVVSLAGKNGTQDDRWSSAEAIEKFWNKADKLSDKHGKTYLESRGIDPEKMPFASVREAQHKSSKKSDTNSFPAIIFPRFDINDNIVAIHAIRCPDGSKLSNGAKITNGTSKGSVIKLPGNKTLDGEIIIVEGPEDALSIWQETGIETWAACSVGNLGAAPVRNGQSIVVIGDADQQTEEHTMDACVKLAGRCASVRLVFPEGDHKDPNEILMADMDNAAEIFGGLIGQAQVIASDTSPDDERRRLITMSEMMADLGPPNWLIEGHLECDTLALLYGAPKTGKTFVTLDMALSIASGNSFHEHQVQQGAVVYIVGEGRSGLIRRTKAWCIEYKVDALTLPVFWSQKGQALTDINETMALSNDITFFADQSDQPIRLIVIDTLNRNFGGADENNTKDMTTFVHNLDYLRSEHGATILVVHHSGLADTKRSRGSSVLYGAVDANMQVAKTGDTTVYTVEVLKDADSPPPMLFSKHVVEFDVPGEGRASSLVLQTSDVPATVVAKEEFFSDYSTLRSKNKRDKFEARLPGIISVMYNGSEAWKSIAGTYGGGSKSTFDGYMKRLRGACLVHPDRYELTDAGKDAARRLVPEIGLADALENADGPSLFSNFSTGQQTGQTSQNGSPQSG